MCGIAGLIIKNPEENYHLPQLLPTMAKAISHRGPDDEGFIIFQPDSTYQQYAGSDTTPATRQRLNLKSIEEGRNGMIGLAHRRLSIIAAGAGGYQPMSYHNGRYWIVYNGEIYNYKELKAKLIKNGFKFETESDTEVILALYQDMGDMMVDVLEGMWAFAIYDQDQKTLFASRDRFGVKPADAALQTLDNLIDTKE
jgi:asparagine synthase (glutamine-hydrolysing)